MGKVENYANLKGLKIAPDKCNSYLHIGFKNPEKNYNLHKTINYLALNKHPFQDSRRQCQSEPSARHLSSAVAVPRCPPILLTYKYFV